MSVVDLRTRIAAVLLAHSEESDDGPDCTCGWEWQGYGLWKDCFAAHVADAVISELGLHRNDEEDEFGGYKPTGRHRYVTEWETDETH